MKKARFLLLALFFMAFCAAYAESAKEEKVVVLPEGIREIGEEAFADDASINCVVIPGGVAIADDAFSGCKNLKTLVILDGATISLENVFSALPIERVYCPAGSEAEKHFKEKGIKVFSLSDYASDSEFATEIRNSGIVITGYRGKDVEVQIPAYIRGIPVIAVGERAFYGNEQLLSVSVPERVTSIGQYAFYGCRALENIDLPKSIAEIGNYAFQNARNIKQIDLNKNLRTLGENPFLNCAMLSTVTGLEENRNYTYSNGMIVDTRAGRVVSYLSNMQAKEVVVPDGITNIGKYAFSYAQTLTKITFSENIEEIGDYAFYECPSLKEVHAEGTIKKIGASAFRNCERLSDIVLSEGLASIGDYAFKNCRSLPALSVPESVQAMGKDVFYLDKPAAGAVMNIVPLYQFHYTKTICVIAGEARSVKTSGCGATCVAMIIRYMKENYNETPETVFEWLYKAGYYKGDGLSHAALSRYLSVSGIGNRWTGSTTEVLNSLKAGKPVIAHMGRGTFADNGHYILLRGIDENGMILVNDPNSRRLTQGAYSLQLIRSQLKTSDGFCIVR